jgi:hypothetical protein
VVRVDTGFISDATLTSRTPSLSDPPANVYVMASRRFFHGTTALLSVGDVLVPGNTIGVSAYGTGPRSAHVYATSGTTDSEHQFAISEAEEWGSDAADSLCDGSTCNIHVTSLDFSPHHDLWRDGDRVPCVRVYEIEPIDLATVEPDDSSDVINAGRRMSEARVLARVL